MYQFNLGGSVWVNQFPLDLSTMLLQSWRAHFPPDGNPVAMTRPTSEVADPTLRRSSESDAVSGVKTLEICAVGSVPFVQSLGRRLSLSSLIRPIYLAWRKAH